MLICKIKIVAGLYFPQQCCDHVEYLRLPSVLSCFVSDDFEDDLMDVLILTKLHRAHLASC